MDLASTRACLDAGIKNILLEKPIANTVEEAEEIIKMCDEADAKLLIGHHRRSSSKYLSLSLANSVSLLVCKEPMPSQNLSLTMMLSGTPKRAAVHS